MASGTCENWLMHFRKNYHADFVQCGISRNWVFQRIVRHAI